MTEARPTLTLRSERAFNGAVVGLVVLGFLVLVAVSAYGIGVMRQNLVFTGWVTHTYQVEGALTDFLVLDERMETARRGYLLSHDEAFATGLSATTAEVDAKLRQIQQLTSDAREQQANIAQLRTLVAQ